MVPLSSERRTAGTAGDRGAHATATELSDAAIDGRIAGTAGDRGAHLASLSEGRRAGWPGS